jgi:hypothetical protein
MNGFNQIDALSQFLFSYASNYSVSWVQVNQFRLKLNATHQALVYIDIRILGGIVHTVKKSTEFLSDVSEETGLKMDCDEPRTR